MLERTFKLELKEAYEGVKALLMRKGCKIVSEDSPKHLAVKQGSLWGMLPTTAKKTVDLSFVANESGTKVSCSSRLSPDWKNITIVGCVLAAVLVGLCLWMASDLTTFVNTGKTSFWSFLASVNGNVNIPVAQNFVNLTKSLAAFLSLIIVLEAAIALYAYKAIDKFIEETFDTLNKETAPKSKKM
ncbi:MAG: hypothetical protein ACLQO7_10190 [Candidatus Bathyarchaeia archaeon]